MAFEELGKCITRPAGSDLSAKQYTFMTINSSGQLATTGNNLDSDGVLQDKPAAQGRGGTIMVGVGITKITAGAAFAVGDYLSSDAAGKAVKAATGDYILGKALESATVAGDVVAMLWRNRSSVA